MDVDYSRTVRHYSRYRRKFPPAFFQRLLNYGVGKPGQITLDVGTGTGNLARDLAIRGADVTGIDPSEELIKEGKILDSQAGVTIDYHLGKVEDLPFEENSFEVVVASQCWHWFKGRKAAREIRRVLVPGGYLVICQYDWISLRGNVVEATENLIQKHNPNWPFVGTTGIYPERLRDVGEEKFEGIESFSFDRIEPFTHEEWEGRMKSCGGVGGSLNKDEIAAFMEELDTILKERFPDSILQIPHRAFAVIARKPGLTGQR